MTTYLQPKCMESVCVWTFVLFPSLDNGHGVLVLSACTCIERWAENSPGETELAEVAHSGQRCYAEASMGLPAPQASPATRPHARNRRPVVYVKLKHDGGPLSPPPFSPPPNPNPCSVCGIFTEDISTLSKHSSHCSSVFFKVHTRRKVLCNACASTLWSIVNI